MPAGAQKLADEKNFEIKIYRIGAACEQVRPPRLVRVAVVQNGIVRPTTDPVKEQVSHAQPPGNNIIQWSLYNADTIQLS